MTSLQDVPQAQSKFELGLSNKTTKGKIDDYQMIFTGSLDPKDEKVQRNPNLVKSKIEEMRLFIKLDT